MFFKNTINPLPSHCPFCHKAFFAAGLNTKYCKCKKGKNLVTEFIEENKKRAEEIKEQMKHVEIILDD